MTKKHCSLLTHNQCKIKYAPVNFEEIMINNNKIELFEAVDLIFCMTLIIQAFIHFIK